MNKRITALLVLSLSAVSAFAAEAEPKPEYMAIFLNDTKIGYASELRTVSGDKVSHEVVMAMELGRGEIMIPVIIQTTEFETKDGKPLSFSTDMDLGGMMNTVTMGEIANGKVSVVSSSMGQTTTKTVDFPAGALLIEGERLLRKAKGFKPGTEYSYLLYDKTDLKANEVAVKVGQAESVTLIGQVRKLIRTENTISISGQKMAATVYVDSDGDDLKYEMPIMGMKLIVVRCDEKFAMSPNGELDLTEAASVATPSAIDNCRQTTDVTFTLKPNKGVELDLPTTDTQTVTKNPDGTLKVQYKIIVAPGKSARPYKGDDEEAKAALEASDYVQSTAPAIKKQASEIVGSETDAGKAAKAIEQWVAENLVAKDLSVGFASALETLKTRMGDCTEHAVLVAALCRAAGIPCRLVNGVAYADEFLGLKRRLIGHMWNQAYIGGKWVDLDAALGADASRIVFGTGDDSTGLIGAVKNLGNFKITAIKVAQ